MASKNNGSLWRELQGSIVKSATVAFFTNAAAIIAERHSLAVVALRSRVGPSGPALSLLVMNYEF